MSIDIFSLFSDEADFVKEEPKKKKNSNVKSSEKTYGLPLEIILDAKKYILTAEEVGTDNATEKELLKAVGNRWRWYASDITRLVFGKNGQAYVCYQGTGAEKGSLMPKENSVFCFGSAEIDIAGLVDEEKGTIGIEAMQEAFRKEYPSYYQDKSELWKQISILQSETGIMVPVLPADPVESIPLSGIEKLSFMTPDHVIIDINRDRLLKVFQERDQSSDEEKKEAAAAKEQLSMESSLPDEKDKKDESDALKYGKQELTASEISKLLEEESIWLGDQAVLSKTGVAGLYSILQKPENRNRKAVSSPAKEKYPVTGTLLSVYYAQYELDPILFDGKKEVEKNELLSFLVKQGHKEYEYTDVRIKYIKKEKLILISSEGSKKGSVEVKSMKEFSWCCDIQDQPDTSGDYFFRQVVSAEHGAVYELVNTPMFVAAVPKENVRAFYFSWKLPKIPGHIYEQGKYISLYIYSIFQTEACLDLYFSIQKQCFLWNMPNQRAFRGSVNTYTEPYLESTTLSGLIKVGQVHSHGLYPAFFSNKDDRDEIVPGIYGVWGNLQTDRVSFKIRAVSGVQQFLMINKDLIFDGEKYDLSNTEKKYLEELADLRLEQPLEEVKYTCICIGEAEFLLLDKAERYSADIYSMGRIFVYDVYEERIESHIYGNMDGGLEFCILSDHELESCMMEYIQTKRKWIWTGAHKSLIEYLSR